MNKTSPPLDLPVDACQTLDLKALQRLFGDDREIQDSILVSFSESLVEYLGELEEAYAASDAEPVRAVAHKMKSSARTVGAYLLGDLCESLEEAAQEGRWAQIHRLVPRFAPAIEAVREYIAELLG